MKTIANSGLIWYNDNVNGKQERAQRCLIMHVNQVRVVMEHSKPIQGKNINNQQMREMKGVGSWDEQDSIWTFEEAEEDALVSFTKQIRESGRMFLPMSDEKIMLEKLYLIDHQHLKNAAAVFYVSRNFVIHRWLYIRMMI